MLALGETSRAGHIEAATALELTPRRQAHTEAAEGFAALEDALQRGYVSLAD